MICLLSRHSEILPSSLVFRNHWFADCYTNMKILCYYPLQVMHVEKQIE
ncbi:hypothetical protein MXB_4161 [Myxobolus squamalis]|nr:hypothetical protein MXB_4161 [Myxobolus squamalis]